MYFIHRASSFKKSLQRLKKSGILKQRVADDIAHTIDLIASGLVLPKEYRDHQLTGDFAGCRECHIKGDLLLIYQRNKDKLILILLDIGTHSELFG
ncbi:MAG TPA: type II toxin-antitoxin system YafQ family toxin [Candidatus Paceibacterota bacterium]|nr:type II toxin-antitoxin system YafQ family toxin [Candidatus Paceibacterota bacterium]